VRRGNGEGGQVEFLRFKLFQLEFEFKFEWNLEYLGHKQVNKIFIQTPTTHRGTQRLFETLLIFISKENYSY
jgi:hypothetical protein